jgi:hypothetical protein
VNLHDSVLKIPANLTIITRENGKIVPKHCRDEHNVWVDLGRAYIARLMAPNTAFTDHYAEDPPSSPREFIQYMGFGIGGVAQTNALAYASPLKDDYPPAALTGVPGDWGNKQTTDDVTITQLERPVKINASTPIWLDSVQTPVTFLNDDKTLVLKYRIAEAGVNLVGPYSIVPISEAALFLCTQDKDAENVYDELNTPSMVGAGRQTIVAYHPFAPIPKSAAMGIEFIWQLRL